MKISKTITVMEVKYSIYNKKTREYSETAPIEMVCGKEPCENAIFARGQKLAGRECIVMGYDVVSKDTKTYVMDAYEFMNLAHEESEGVE